MPDRGDDLAAYARARVADGAGDAATAAAGYSVALAASPDNVALAYRVYRQGLEAGDDALVARALTPLDAARQAPPDAPLLRIAEALATADAARARAATTRLAKGPFEFLVAPLSAWLALDAGQDAVAVLDGIPADPAARRYIAETRALLLIASGRSDDGIAAVRALLRAGRADADLRIPAAALLAGQGRGAAAQALLPGDEPLIAGVRDRLGAGVKPSARFGIARLYLRLAVDLAQGAPTPLSIVLTRAALRLEPGNDRARLLLADALSRGGSTAAAVTMLDAVAATSAYHRGALRLRVTLLDRAGAGVQALAAAQALFTQSPTAAEAITLGDMLSARKRPRDAATVYSLAIERSGDAAHWTLYLRLAAALDEAGDWRGARGMLDRARRIEPEAPLLLNYLGYGQVERGEKLDESVALLERAYALAPDSGSIADSLGWGYFRRGEVARALPLLERAARGEPGNSTINEHLGDAYWALGRRYEARYAWQAALVTSEAADAVRLSGKLLGGTGKRVRR